jgi:DegV family protein with EDD domain
LTVIINFGIITIANLSDCTKDKGATMVKIIIDSAADISKSEAESLGIEMLPVIISFGDKDYYDGENLTATEFYEKLASSNVVPKTAQVNPFRWEEAFARFTENGDEVLAITISSKLSGTYQSACQASEKFNGKVRVVDSLNACAGERLLCEYAISLAKEGLSLNEIADKLEENKGRIKVLAVIGTLEYLKKGGRISAVAAFAGEILSLKPLIAVIDGEVKVTGKAMGFRKGLALLNKQIDDTKGIDFSMPISAIYSGETENLEKFIQTSQRIWEGVDGEIPKSQLGATIGTHIGPGVAGIAFFENK